MKNLFSILLMAGLAPVACSQGGQMDPAFEQSEDLKITKASVEYDSELEHLVFSMEVSGQAGNTLPSAVGQLDGAPVLGYVFPTSLKSTDVGFGPIDGIVALALTSHPDFDDTPLWDENADQNFTNDGVIWHPHWVVLESNESVPGGLAVKQFDPKSETKLPPTNPGMPMYMDSPGYNTVTKESKIRVVVPSFRMNRITTFNFDGVTAYMQVNTSNPDLPMLGVYAVYSVASGDLSLPYSVKNLK